MVFGRRLRQLYAGTKFLIKVLDIRSWVFDLLLHQVKYWPRYIHVFYLWIYLGILFEIRSVWSSVVLVIENDRFLPQIVDRYLYSKLIIRGYPYDWLIRREPSLLLLLGSQKLIIISSRTHADTDVVWGIDF